MPEIKITIANKSLEELPSLREALKVNDEGVQRQNTIIGILKRELADQETKIEIAEELNLPIQSFKSYRTRLKSQIISAEKTAMAYKSGYLEIPDFGEGLELKEKDESWHWRFNLGGKTPLRVLQALKEAKDKGIFEKIVVFQRGRDPIITGKIGNLYFFITSYK